MKNEAEERRDALKFEFELDAPLAKVWRALTIPEYVARWLTVPAKDAQTHKREDPSVAPLRPLPLRLVDCEPLRSIRYSWIDEDDLSPANLVTFRVSPNHAGGTTFRIIHERFVGDDVRRTVKAANSNAPRLLRAA